MRALVLGAVLVLARARWYVVEDVSWVCPVGLMNSSDLKKNKRCANLAGGTLAIVRGINYKYLFVAFSALSSTD